MTIRTKLEETLAAQRARRNRNTLPAQYKKGRGLISALMVIAILAASGAAMFFALDSTIPVTNPTATVLPSASPLVYTMSVLTTVPATPVEMKVCTDIPNGRLHVRFAAGEGSEVRGYLIEGETVQLAPTSNGKKNQDNLWLHIASPVAGWVNARYVCKQEK
jgi:hypothetical protein